MGLGIIDDRVFIWKGIWVNIVLKFGGKKNLMGHKKYQEKEKKVRVSHLI